MTAGGPGPRRRSGDRAVGRLLEDAYATRVGIDTAARHLWSVDREARRLARRRRHQRLATTVASVVLLLAGVGTVAGSATAVPGEPLYPVKDGLERAELTMAISDTAHARAHVRHSRARLEEIEQVAQSHPELVPELAARFYASLQRAAESGEGAIVSEVAALRNSGAVLFAELARDLDPSIVRSLAGVRGVPDSVAAVLPAGGGAARGSASRPSPDGGSGGAAADGGAPSAPEPMVSTPETAVADAGPSEDASDADDAAASPTASEGETAVVAPPPQTSVAGVAEPAAETGTVDTPQETASGESTPTPSPEPGASPTPRPQPGPTPTPGEPPAQTPAETTTSQAATSGSAPATAGDGGPEP